MLLKLKPYNVIDRTDLPEVTVEQLPVNGDPLEINSQMYFVCETNNQVKDGTQIIRVIPHVIKNATKAKNTESYLESLSVALRRMQYI